MNLQPLFTKQSNPLFCQTADKTIELHLNFPSDVDIFRCNQNHFQDIIERQSIVLTQLIFIDCVLEHSKAIYWTLENRPTKDFSTGQDLENPDCL